MFFIDLVLSHSAMALQALYAKYTIYRRKRVRSGEEVGKEVDVEVKRKGVRKDELILLKG